ncbi:MAG TPA: hypothetical protein VLQ67_07855, partial [Arachnia sp.]|nr:hypothetical protein [Arachnia sp.]
VITFDLHNVTDTSGRGPPPAGTLLAQTFTVVGATADVVLTVPVADDPETPLDETGEATRPLSGATVGRDLLNQLKYLEIRFRGTSGFGIDHTTIGGGEIEFRGPDGALIALGAPVRVGTSDIYRFSFTATLPAGTYTVTFLAGRFADLGGNLNAAETETLYVTSPASSITNPGAGSVVDAKEFTGRGWIDVTFPDFGLNGLLLDRSSITDADAEFSIRDANGDLVVIGTGVLVTGNTYRYYFSGYTSGALTLTFLDGAWLSVDGTPYSAATHGTPTSESLTEAIIKQRTWLAVRLTPTFGSSVNTATLGSDDLTLTGAGAEALTWNHVRFVEDGANGSGIAFYGYLFPSSGQLAAGTLTVTFNAGAWKDTADNFSAAGSETVRVIVQGTSFYIELSGGIMLSAGDFLPEPLLHITAEVILEIDLARTAFILTFQGQISVYGLGAIGATAGRFVLVMGDENTNPMYPVPQLWGVASIETNFEELEQYGLYISGSAQLRINLTNEVKTETLTLKGVGPGGTDLTETFVLQPFSFGFQILGQLIVAPGGTELMRVQGGVYLQISMNPPTPSMELFLTGSMSFGSGSARLEYGSVTGVLMISTRTTGGAIPGVAGSIRVSSGVGIGLPDIGTLFSARGSVSVIFNTTLVEQSFTVPDAFIPLLLPGQSPTFVIPASAPGIDGQPVPGRTPSIYITAVIEAELTIGGLFTLTGMLAISAGVDPTYGAFLEITGIVGTTIPLLGAMTGAINLNVYVGTRTGVVGRVQLTRASNSIPGLSLNGQFLLEINTFSTAQTVETFKVKTETVNGRQVFGGFERDVDNKLIPFTQTIGVVAGFRVEFYGSLVVSNVLDIFGHVVFTLGADGIELLVNGNALLEPFGGVTITDSGFSITSRGLVARIDIGLDASFGGDVGLKFNAAALLEINTTGANATLGSTTVTPGFKLRIEGSISFLGFAKGEGFAEIRIGGNAFVMSFGVSFDLAGLKFNANGVAGIYDDGLVMRVSVSVSADAFVFSLSATGLLSLNTTPEVREGVERGFKLQLTGSVTLL